MSPALSPLPTPSALPVSTGWTAATWRGPLMSLGASSGELPPRPGRLLPFSPFSAPESTERAFPSSWPLPLAALPIDSDWKTKDVGSLPVASKPAPPEQLPSLAPSVALPPRPEVPLSEPVRDFSDDDLREAFGPIVHEAVRKAVYARENGIDTYLEPMLRSTIRRALAEYTPTQRPFQAPSVLDRMVWRLQALFTSRTYEDIIFDKTHRFQVEEVFLLDVHSLALISFASNQPGRHASAKRVEGTIQRLALQLRDEEGKIRHEFDLPEHRMAVSRSGRFTVLVAVVRGKSNELVLADLEFALKRIEDHFRERFAPGGPPLLKDLQPFLEDCLLIQAPAHAN
jgi:hypothetical protein